MEERINIKSQRKSDGHLVGMEVKETEHDMDQVKDEYSGNTRNFQSFRSIADIQETEIGILLHQNQSDGHLYTKHNIGKDSEMQVTEVSYVAENVASRQVDVRQYKDKHYIKLNSVSSEHLANMETDDDVFNETSDTDGINDDSIEDDRTSCVCKCHSRRHFQKRGLTKNSKLKSSSYDRNNSSDKLLNHSRRNKAIGVIKDNESNQTLFRTRLKSENSSERSSFGISEGHKLCINLECLRIRINMAKILCHCVILMLLCLCGGVVMVHLNAEKMDSSVIHRINVGGFKNKGDAVIEKPDPSILLDLPFRSVSKEVFQNHLAKSNSAADMLKIFFSDSSLTEEQVNSIMYMKQHQSNYGSRSAGDDMMMRDEEDDTDYRELAYQHYVEFERNPLSDCHEPQPEVVRIEETNSDSVLHFLPSCTIIHRCKNETACCPRGHICAPKKENGIQLVDKFFMVLEAVPGSDELKPAKEFIAAKTFINHTACECQKVEIDTNCQKDCPQQFTKTRPGADCECKCASGHRKCNKINKGLLPLDEKDLECIKEDKCIVPTCHSGKFSISSGFCPHFRRSRKGQ